MAEKKYLKTHEWVELLDDGTAQIGISEHAAEELGDIVFVGLGEVGDEVEAGSSCADVESVKAVSEIISPVSGTIVEVNADLLDSPELINEAPLDTWFIRVENPVLADDLLDEDDYQDFIEG